MFRWLKQKILTIFGRIKISKYPMWISYSPTTFMAKGEQYRKAVELLKPGYVIGRGYNDYLDGYFIPGDYSHTGLCVSNNSDKSTVIHSMAFGVFEQDLIDFLRCDRFIIFKPKKYNMKAVRIARTLLGKKYDFDFSLNNNSYYCHEMTATCFPDLDIPTDKKLGKKIYTIKSFIDSKDFEVVYEYNPKRNNL